MSPAAIKVENLGKQYRIGGTRAAYRTFRESVTEAAQAPFRRAAKLLRGQAYGAAELDESIWALKDVCLEVGRGEVVGIIGRNGAGKSTLLKVLSRITEPTEGRAEIHGRVGSLLEVGTGFHHELTGGENIYLNGAILGMKRAEIASKFDDIVEFAEIGKFINTPVKHYSSGMYVRLAFAVAAHLEPEILLVDEVLAVGDAAFQRKCLGKMGDISGEGRTVLLVSHNMTSIVKLCEHAIWLDDGRVRAVDGAQKTVQAYLASGLSGTNGRVEFDDAGQDKPISFSSVELRNGNGEVAADFDVLSPIEVNLAFRCRRRLAGIRLDAVVLRYDGIPVFSTTSQDHGHIPGRFDPGDYRARVLIPGQFLSSGEYYLTVNICEVNVRDHDLRESVLRFRITGTPYRTARNLGFLVYPFEWELVP
jgi:lipopolysaccharide transport system ATP-binding protein